MALSLEELTRRLDSEAAQRASQRTVGANAPSSPWWVPAYTWENQLYADQGQTVDFLVRHITHEEYCPLGLRMASTHRLLTRPSDDPKRGGRAFYCKENFHQRGEDGELPPDGRCYFCEVYDVVDHELFEQIKLKDPVRNGGFSGELIARALQTLANNRKVLVPFIIQAKKRETDDGKDVVLVPSADENDQLGIVLCANYMSSLHKSLLECYKEDPNLSSVTGGRWLKLTRQPKGKWHNSVLTPKVTSTPLKGRSLQVLQDFPKLHEWGKKPPGQQSSRTTLNVTYAEAENLFKTSLWYNDLYNMTKDDVDWDG